MINKKILPLIVGISSFGINYTTNGQIQKVDKVEITQNFQHGQLYRYEVQRGKIDSREPGTENIKSSTNIEFRVFSDKKGFKECSWKYCSTKVSGINPVDIDEQSRKLLNIYEGMEVKFLIDAKGTVQEITNFEECKKHVETTFKLINDNASQKLTQEQYTKMMEALKASYETPEILVSSYCPELLVFFSMFGETIKCDSVYISNSDLPNPFGGRNFPTHVITKIDNITNDIASISVKQVISVNDLNTIMKETFIELFKHSDKPFNENEIPRLNMATSSTYAYDFQKNILNEIYTEKLVEAEGVRQKQTLKVVLKNYPD